MCCVCPPLSFFGTSTGVLPSTSRLTVSLTDMSNAFHADTTRPPTATTFPDGSIVSHPSTTVGSDAPTTMINAVTAFQQA